MKTSISIMVLIIGIIMTFLVTSYLFNTIKENDINNLKGQINDLTDQLDQYRGTDDMFVGTWNRTLGDPHAYYDSMVLYSNYTGFLNYYVSGTDPVNYSFRDGKLAFESMGYDLREFSYTFHNDHTLIMVESEEFEGFSVYIKI